MLNISSQADESWTDTHAHLDKLKIHIPDMLQAAQEQNVSRIISIGTELKDWQNIIDLSEKYCPRVYGALGMHPHNAKDFNAECESFLKTNLTNKRIVAVAEIGLDYYYSHSEKNIQQAVFEKQLMLAKHFKMPVEIHSRDAEQDTLFFMKQVYGDVQGLIHCFSGSYKLASQALDYGFDISFSGILTFKNSSELREICKKIPLDRLHIETDSPFLSPIPYRGKENHPAYVTEIAKTLACLHKIDLPTLSKQLQRNTLKLFPKIAKQECQI